MRLRPDNSRPTDRGQILVMAIILIPVCLGAAAMAVDIGVMWAVEAKLRTVADASALAGGQALVMGQSNSEASTAATSIASANAYTAFGQTSTVTINIPPTAPSAFAGQDGCVQAVVTFNQPALFSAIWGFRRLPVTVEAVAQLTQTPYSTAAILLLAPSGTAMTLSGSSQVVAVDGGITVDSSSSTSVISSGSSSITAPELNLAGGMKYTGTNPDNATVTNYDQPQVPDPLVNIAAPGTAGMPVESSSAIRLAGTQTETLNPGIYTGGISLSGSAAVTLNPGIYYINGGGINLSGSSSITGNGVFIYNTGGGAINLSGTGSVSLSAMSSGAYAGITIFQDRADTSTATMSGGSNVNNTGTFYFPDAALTLSGGSGVGIVGSQFITKTLAFSGTGGIHVNYAAKSVASKLSINLVE